VDKVRTLVGGESVENVGVPFICEAEALLGCLVGLFVGCHVGLFVVWVGVGGLGC